MTDSTKWVCPECQTPIDQLLSNLCPHCGKVLQIFSHNTTCLYSTRYKLCIILLSSPIGPLVFIVLMVLFSPVRILADSRLFTALCLIIFSVVSMYMCTRLECNVNANSLDLRSRQWRLAILGTIALTAISWGLVILSFVESS